MVAKISYDNIEDVELGDMEGQFKDVSDLQKDIDAQIDAIFQEFGGDDNDSKFKIIVKRAMQGKGDLEHCFSCVPSELPIIDRIKETYGPGSYEIWVYKDGKIFKRPKLNIAKEIKRYDERPKINHNDINSVMQAMAHSQQEQMTEFKNMMLMMMQKNNTPVASPTDMMASMMGMMVQMKEFVGPDSGKGKMNDILEAVKLVKEIGGDGSDGGRNFMDGMVDLAKSFGPSIIEMSNNIAKNAPQQKPIIPTQQNPEQIEATPQEEDSRMHIFKMQLEMLTQKASINSDPALYADLVVDNIPQDQLMQFIERPDILEYLIAIQPAVGQHREWFLRLISEIKICIGPDGVSSIEDNDSNIDPTSPEWAEQENLTDIPESANTVDSDNNIDPDQVIDAPPATEKETDK